MKRNKRRRFIRASLLSVLCAGLFSSPAYASGPFDVISGAANGLSEAYRVITYIAIPMAVISVVIGALRFFGFGILSTKNADQQLESGRRQIVITMIALCCIYIAPLVISTAFNFAQTYKWVPTQDSSMFDFGGNSFGSYGGADAIEDSEFYVSSSGENLISEKNPIRPTSITFATKEQFTLFNQTVGNITSGVMTDSTGKLTNILNSLRSGKYTVSANDSATASTFHHAAIPERFPSPNMTLWSVISQKGGNLTENDLKKKVEEIERGTDGFSKDSLTLSTASIALQSPWYLNFSSSQKYDMIVWSKSTAKNLGDSTGSFKVYFWYSGGIVPGATYCTQYIDNWTSNNNKYPSTKYPNTEHASVPKTVDCTISAQPFPDFKFTYRYPASEYWKTPAAEPTFAQLIAATCKDYNLANGTTYTEKEFNDFFHDQSKAWPWYDEGAGATDTVKYAKDFYRFYLGYSYEIIHGGRYASSNCQIEKCNLGSFTVEPAKLAAQCRNTNQMTYSAGDIRSLNAVAGAVATEQIKDSTKYYMIPVVVSTEGSAEYKAPATSSTLRLWIPVDWCN